MSAARDTSPSPNEPLLDVVSTDVHETIAAGAQLCQHLADDAVVLLLGEMGAGKTVLAQGIAQGLGIAPSRVQSPTFGLIHEYRDGEARMMHLDLYRLTPEEVEGLGLDELLMEDCVKVIEWPDRLPTAVDGVRVQILQTDSVADAAAREGELEASAQKASGTSLASARRIVALPVRDWVFEG